MFWREEFRAVYRAPTTDIEMRRGANTLMIFVPGIENILYVIELLVFLAPLEMQQAS